MALDPKSVNDENCSNEGSHSWYDHIIIFLISSSSIPPSSSFRLEKRASFVQLIKYSEALPFSLKEFCFFC